MSDPRTRVFISTGIHEFDELLKRRVPGEASGIALPTAGGAASSAMIIRGPLGAGKSALAAFMGYHIHAKPILMGGRVILPYVIYFSYSQPAQGLYNYIDEILIGETGDHSSVEYYPLIISPQRIHEEQARWKAFQDFLLEHFKAFWSEQPGDARLHGPWEAVRPVLEQYRTDLCRGKRFHCELARKTIPERLLFSDRQPVHAQNIEVRPVVCIDPINFFFDDQQRSGVAQLMAFFRERNWPLIATIEDAGADASEKHRQLMSFVQFDADVVVELTVRATPYVRRTIEVKKNRNSQPIFGPQFYRIEGPNHSLSNIPSTWQGKRHPGFLIFPSIHWFLSHARKRTQHRHFYYSGMNQFDLVLRDGVPQTAEELRYFTGHPEERPTLPPDSLILVRGDKGGHKLSIGFNLLAAGLWNFRHDEGETEEERKKISRNVMLLSLGEEINLTIPKIALGASLRGKKERNNCYQIAFGSPEEPDTQRNNSGGKILLREWPVHCPTTKKLLGPKLIEATFKPGHLSPDEFLWVVETLVKNYAPSRILVENTAHLRMRFPELHSEQMLFPALSSLTQANRIMLMVTDVLGQGSDRERSYGLAASADFVVDLSPLTIRDFLEKEHYAACLEHLDKATQCCRPQPAWSKMSVSNVRGKNYRRKQCGVTVFAKDGVNSLFIENITEHFIPDYRSSSTSGDLLHD